MKTSYILGGLNDPATIVEVAGSVYFSKNYHAKYYTIKMVTIEQGRLCVYYTADGLSEKLMVPKDHYIKLKPNLDSVKLVIKEYEPHRHSTSHIVYYLVDSVHTPARGDYFRFRKYEADVDWPASDNATCNVSAAFLVEHGYVCTDELDDDGESVYTIYRRKH